MRVKPVLGRRVRHPVSKLPIPAEGVEVSDTDTYWFRRIRCGDVEIVPDVVVTETQIPDSYESASQGED